MKPDVKTAMLNLIKEAREKLPFDMSFSGNCVGRCEECPFKLLEYLDIDLSSWEFRLKRGDVPTIGDLHSLGRQCQQVHDILLKQGIGHGCEPSV